MFTASAALGQSIGNGSGNVNSNGNGNGNGNSGSGNGNGNGNGSGNSYATNVSARGNTPSFAAAGLAAAGIESCLASASAGGAGGGIAVTVAGPILDKGCDIRLYSRTLFATGHRLAATQMLCNDPQAAQALATEGVRCFVGVGAEMQNPRPDPNAVSSIFNCRHYVLFQGCLDEPPSAVAALDTGASTASVEPPSTATRSARASATRPDAPALDTEASAIYEPAQPPLDLASRALSRGMAPGGE